MLDCDAFARIRRRAVLEGCKWDPQVGDVSTLANFPLLLQRRAWQTLAELAEQLTAETLNAEREILNRPELLDELGLPRSLCGVLKLPLKPTPAAARVMRFDFHWTTDGWAISEVNSDVPGGFTEASFFTDLMGEHFPPAQSTGRPIDAWADALARVAEEKAAIALLSAPGFMEDHQVVAYLAQQFRARHRQTHLANPRQIFWRNGVAFLATAWFSGRLDAVVRFFQGEWLAELPRRSGWPYFFRGGHTPVGNPGLAVITESKRFPLVWNRLATPLKLWPQLLPETRDPRAAPWQTDDTWLIKSALCNTGDEVCVRQWMSARDWRRAQWQVRLRPGHWAAQRRFASVPLTTPNGPRHACLGVYTIDGRAVGTYARLAPRPLIDFAAVDAAVLVEDDD